MTFASIPSMDNALQKINNNTLTSAFDSDLSTNKTKDSSFDSLLDSAINLING